MLWGGWARLVLFDQVFLRDEGFLLLLLSGSCTLTWDLCFRGGDNVVVVVVLVVIVAVDMG